MARVHPRYQTSPDVVSRRVGEETILVNLTTNQFFELNRTATRLWELLSEGLDLTAVANRLLDEFDVEATSVHAEIDAALDELSRHSLIVPADAAVSPEESR